MKLKKLLSLALAAALTVSSVQFSAAASAVSKTNEIKTTVTENISRENIASGDSISQNGLLFTELDNGSYEVGYDYNGEKPVGTIVIPEKVNGKLVTRISEAGFANCGELLNVVVPNCVISAGTNAFYGTKFLNNQNGPVKYAGKVAVYCDPEAEKVEIAEGTLGLADKLFYRSPELVSAKLPAGLLNLGSMTFNDCQKLTTVNIPQSIITIGSGVFADCVSLKAVTIPSGVTGIGAYAFYHTALEKITIPKSVTKIGKGAFENSSLNTNDVTIGSGYIDIGGRAFYGTPFYGAQGNLKYAGNVFLGCDSSVTKATLKAGTAAIADMAFSGHDNITSITIPTSVKTIGSDAFFNCPKLTAITIPEGVESIGEDAFRLCEELETVSLPISVKAIGQGAFYGCSKLKTINYPGSASDWAKNFTVGGYNTALLNVQPTLGKNPKKPEAVTGLKVAKAEPNSISLSWNKSAAATIYRIDTMINGKWKTLGNTYGSNTEFTVKDLEAYTEYKFRVYAISRNILSTPVDISAKTRVQGVSNVKAASTKDSVTLSWKAPSNADYYRVDIYKSGKWQEAAKTKSGAETSHVIKGLNAKTTYQFRICAFKGEDHSPFYLIKATTTVDTTPLTVTGLKAAAAKSNSITLSWNKTVTADSYEIDVYKDGKWRYAAKITGNTYTVSGLTANTSYDFRVFSFNGSKYSSSARLTAKTAAPAPNEPLTVTGLKATAAKSNCITLSWNKTVTADSYEIDVYKDGKWRYAAKITGNTYTVSGLTANTSYNFRVFSFKGSKYSSSARLTAKTAAPAPNEPLTVTGLKATAAKSNSITLSWNKTVTADSYEIDVYKDGKWRYAAKITGNTCTVSGLNANTSYDFRVFSFKGSKYSSSARITVKTAAPASNVPLTVTGLKATAAGSNSITLSWNKTSTADSYEIDMYKNGKWVYVAKITGNSYKISGLSANTSYNFKVFSFKGRKYSSSARITAKTAAPSSSVPLTVTGLKATAAKSNSITLSWNKTSTADSYEIDMYKNGKWTYLAKVTGNSYTASGLSANTSYNFKVFSFKGSKYSNSAALTAKTAASVSSAPATVTGLKASADVNSITLSWNKTATADSYEIDMYKNGKWTYLTKVTGGSYTVRGLSANTSYNFKVFSFKGSKYSNSAAVTAKTSGAVLAPSINYTIAPEDVKPAELSSTQVMMKGIDVSGWQGEIDFRAVKSSGVDFVIVKTGEEDVIVDTWEKNFKNAKDAGLLVGAYWFCTSTTITDAKKEVQRFIGALKGKKLDFPVYLDMETMGQFDNGKDFCTQLVETFCSELEKAGYCAGVYCSTYWYTNYVDDNVRLKRPNWIAQYDDKCYYNGSYGMWQFDADTVPGVEFDCDRNWGYFDYSEYIKAHKLNGF